MEKLIMENFRCFAGRHEIPLKPLTVLVGENSSGKSSFLAAVRLAWDVVRRRGEAEFNEEPFWLGAYEQLATYRGGRVGRSKSFSIGMQTHPARRLGRLPVSAELRFEAAFSEQNAQPVLVKRSVSYGAYALLTEVQSIDHTVSTASTPSGTWPIPAGDVDGPRVARLPDWLELLYSFGGRRLPGQAALPGLLPPPDEWAALSDLAEAARSVGGFRPYAIAPVRTRPKRTYDPVKDTPDPEGQHIPMVLARTLDASIPGRGPLRDSLMRFGEASGLFTGINVRQLGKEGDPFQILIKTTGPARNLMDVGYGISQVLPILVELFTASAGRTFLIQQPEVHLHPRAQAALATLFGQLVKERRLRLLVETHSDHFIDRVRIDVRDNLTGEPDGTQILYFDTRKDGSVIHPIDLDEVGNVLGAPAGYRQFFTDELHRSLGID